MSPTQKEKYMELVINRQAEVTRQLKAAEHARNTADSKMTSRYDTQRENFNVEVNLHQDTLEKIRQFTEFLNVSGACYRMQEGAVCSIYLFESGEEEKDLLISPVLVNLGEVKIITPKAPLGAALMGKLLAAEFNYKMDVQDIRGIITDLQ